MHPHEHQIVRGHLVRCWEHRDEQVVPLQLRADGLYAKRLQPYCVVGDADGTEPFELAQEKAKGVTVGIDPLLPLPAGLLRLQLAVAASFRAPASWVIRTPSRRLRNSLVTSAGPCPSRSRSSATTGSESSAASRVVSRTTANAYSQASSASLSSARSSSHPASSPGARSSPSLSTSSASSASRRRTGFTAAVCTVVLRTSPARARRSARSADRLAWAASSASSGRRTGGSTGGRSNASSRSMSSQLAGPSSRPLR